LQGSLAAVPCRGGRGRKKTPIKPAKPAGESKSPPATMVPRIITGLLQFDPVTTQIEARRAVLVGNNLERPRATEFLVVCDRCLASLPARQVVKQ
jgi:hypothetical protein